MFPNIIIPLQLCSSHYFKIDHLFFCFTRLGAYIFPLYYFLNDDITQMEDLSNSMRVQNVNQLNNKNIYELKCT